MSAQQGDGRVGHQVKRGKRRKLRNKGTTRIKTAATSLDAGETSFRGRQLRAEICRRSIDGYLRQGRPKRPNVASHDAKRAAKCREGDDASCLNWRRAAFGQLFGTASTTPGGVGGLLGGLAKLFGGARAEGGDVRANTPYLVGERGPEILVPRGAGSIIPNSKIALGGGSRNVVTHNNVSNVTVNANGGGGNGASNQDLAQKVGRAVQDQMQTMVMGAIRQQMKPGGILAG